MTASQIDQEVEVQKFEEQTMVWTQAEWDDETAEELKTLVVTGGGLELSVTPTEWIVDRDRQPKQVLTWEWLVKLTSEVSETPEVVDYGVSKSLRAAQRGARGAAN